MWNEAGRSISGPRDVHRRAAQCNRGLFPFSASLGCRNVLLQITNEDLGTAREELQSLRELTTVNEELRQANLELTELNADLETSYAIGAQSSWRSSDDKSSENQLRFEGPTLLFLGSGKRLSGVF